MCEIKETNKKFVENFIYTYSNLKISGHYKIKVPIDFPFEGNINELACRIISGFNLPIYVLDDIIKKLEMFINDHSEKLNDCLTYDAIDCIKNETIEIEDIVKYWEKAFKEETVTYSNIRGASNDQLFATAFHKLAHSGPSLDAILHIEYGYAQAVQDIITRKKRQILSVTKIQTEEMNYAMEGLNKYSNEEDINALALKHFDDQTLIQGKWNSKLDTLKQEQRNGYREWIMKTVEEMQGTDGIFSPIGNSPIGSIVNEFTISNSSLYDLEESFTIHLGSQMKSTHNIRIMSADTLDLLRITLDENGTIMHHPQRLQTVLELYSHDLKGLVLFTDTNNLDFYSGLAKEFFDICEGSTEFHFASLQDQLETMKSDLKVAVENRKCKGPISNFLSPELQARRNKSKLLQCGDVYITKHSNLASVHLIFHMVIDDSLKSDTNSRHPVILGLRNILKAACSYDITMITIPLFLNHEMTEDMTVPWCQKRAELVLKCVKGFMIESVSLGGSELKTIQFLVPKGISEEVFGILATMVPTIFRVSTPLVFNSTEPEPKLSTKNKKYTKSKNSFVIK
ncbi:protein C12orf4 homolog isoform X2 [Daktulosphaira vitifoliae]|uniref:protein C12orf4 homolog isoform X2 n=1 Tax=Daktulosphaira vitifoliae TaxID=58002 RepID=UPI0021A9A9A6|nr:protein C12orf4 homolog isoform X2 [Daktulosphaira vitifoliae]